MGKKKKKASPGFLEEIFNPIGKPSQNSVGIAPIRDIPLKDILFHCKITHFIPVNAHEPVGWGKIPVGRGKKRDFRLCWSLRIGIGLPQSLNLNPSNQSLPQPKLINGFQLILHLRAISEDVWAVMAVGDFKTLLVRERTCSAPNCCLHDIISEKTIIVFNQISLLQMRKATMDSQIGILEPEQDTERAI
ncbi:hypothetical protein CEXT_154181 [Caerostris extrusa]|uniref:Uncharacterized protein n=1 Tax=Caerostris extrusa TaxID=172846 RepID=A0AAV4Y315_CAEEX|nr:hypothetical protein CEXT_154181 [Caerostris extrusa]